MSKLLDRRLLVAIAGFALLWGASELARVIAQRYAEREVKEMLKEIGYDKARQKGLEWDGVADMDPGTR